MVSVFVDSQTVSKSEVSEIEKCTRGQASSQRWLDHRKERLTAEKFYTAAVNTVEPSKRILYSKLNLNSTRHGIQYESEALKKYSGNLAKKCIFLHVEHPGFIVSKTHPYLRASLDAIVTDINPSLSSCIT